MFETHFIEEVVFKKESKEYPGLEIQFTLEIEGFYREEKYPLICSNPDHPSFSDPGEEEIFEIHSIRVIEGHIHNYPEEGRNITDLIEDIEAEIDLDRQQGLIEKLSIKTGIGDWNNIPIDESEEEEIRKQIICSIKEI